MFWFDKLNFEEEEGVLESTRNGDILWWGPWHPHQIWFAWGPIACGQRGSLAIAKALVTSLANNPRRPIVERGKKEFKKEKKRREEKN